jgi:hypothetical protein
MAIRKEGIKMNGKKKWVGGMRKQKVDYLPVNKFGEMKSFGTVASDGLTVPAPDDWIIGVMMTGRKM